MFSLPTMAMAKPPSAQVLRAITQAIQAGNPNNLAALLEQHKLSVNSVIRAGGDTLLHMAVGEGTPEVVEYLLDNDADVNVTDRYGYTPLDEALALDNMEMVALLGNAGGEHSEGFRPLKAAPTASGDTPSAPLTLDERLLRAAVQGDTERVEQLLGIGADIHAKDKLWGQTPLHNAAWRGETETAELLIEKGADIHAKDEWGQTPLHKAAWRGETETVELLIEKGADIHARDEEMKTPLHEAARGGETETVELLIEKGADIQDKNEWGQTPLHLAAGGERQRLWRC